MDTFDEAKEAVHRPIDFHSTGVLGAFKRIIRSFVFRTIRPFVSNQQEVNVALLDSIGEVVAETAQRHDIKRQERVLIVELLGEVRRLSARVEDLEAATGGDDKRPKASESHE